MRLDNIEMPRLGFGLMRLPLANGEIDIPKVCRMADICMENGFNYFDTAYVYHEGKSESAAKSALTDRYPRESFLLATKMPGWMVKNAAGLDAIFADQLMRAGVDYYDFYLLHSIEEGYNYDIHEKLGGFDWAKKMKAKGKIRHIGFSFHGTPALLERVLDAHPETEFVQIQLNYADWNNPLVQSGALYRILRERNMPIIVMEPVKGGMLANLTPDLEEMLKAAHPESSPASWALRFVGSLDGISTILSGMSSEEQVKENVALFKNLKPIDDGERAVIDAVVRKMVEKPLIQCTSCRYCCDGCPAKISIPDVFRAVNTARLYPEDNRPKLFYDNMLDYSSPAKDCAECGQCESVCPQHLPIVELMKEASRLLD